MERRKRRSAPARSSSVLFAVPTPAPEARHPRLGGKPGPEESNSGRPRSQGVGERPTSRGSEPPRRSRGKESDLGSSSACREPNEDARQSSLETKCFTNNELFRPEILSSCWCGDRSETSRNTCPGGLRAGPPPAGGQPLPRGEEREGPRQGTRLQRAVLRGQWERRSGRVGA